jgi:hypothetical protein
VQYTQQQTSYPYPQQNFLEEQDVHFHHVQQRQGGMQYPQQQQFSQQIQDSLRPVPATWEGSQQAFGQPPQQLSSPEQQHRAFMDSGYPGHPGQFQETQNPAPQPPSNVSAGSSSMLLDPLEHQDLFGSYPLWPDPLFPMMDFEGGTEALDW